MICLSFKALKNWPVENSVAVCGGLNLNVCVRVLCFYFSVKLYWRCSKERVAEGGTLLNFVTLITTYDSPSHLAVMGFPGKASTTHWHTRAHIYLAFICFALHLSESLLCHVHRTQYSNYSREYLFYIIVSLKGKTDRKPLMTLFKRII